MFINNNIFHKFRHCFISIRPIKLIRFLSNITNTFTYFYIFPKNNSRKIFNDKHLEFCYKHIVSKFTTNTKYIDLITNIYLVYDNNHKIPFGLPFI